MGSKDEKWRAFGGPGVSQYPPLSLGMMGGDGPGGTASLLPSGLGLGALANSSNSSSPVLTGASSAPRFTATAATNTSPQLAAILGAGPLSSSNSTSSSASSSASAAGLLSSSSKPFVPRTQQQQPVPALHQQLAHQHLSPSLTGSSVTSAGSMDAPFMLPPQRPAVSLPLQQSGAPQDDTAALCLQMASSCLLQDGASGKTGRVGEPEEEEDDVVGLAMEAALDRAYLLLDEEDDAGDEELLEDPFFFTGGGSAGSGSFGLGGGSGLGGGGGGSGSSLDQYDAGPAGAAAGGNGGYMASGFYGDNGGGYGEAYGGGYGGQGPPMPGFGRQGSHPGYGGGGGGGGYHPHHHHQGGYHHPGGQQMYLRDAAVSVLLEYFPQCSPRALLVALRRCEFDIEAAARCVEAALRPSVPPCRYYLAGFCARSDCQYSHEVAQMPCTYWLMGGCRDPKEGPTPEDEEPQEGSCCFLHDFQPMPAPPTPPLSALMAAAAGMGALSLPPAAAPPAASPTISPDDEEQFPALTPSKPSSYSASSASAAKPTNPAPAAATGQTPAKSFLQVALSTDKVKKSASIAGTATATATATAAGAASGASGASGAGAGGPKTVGLKDLVSRQKLASVWVMGGEEVRRQYQRAREEASRAAQARNRCFMQATAAFQRGDKAAAKALGEQGRNMNALMRAQHRQAALTIFASRNPSDARIYQEGIVDLHGLHVQEALEMLEELLPDIFRVSGPKEVLVITGTGRHSGAVSKHQSRLFPALDDHLREIAGAMARKQSRGTSGAVSVDAAAAALYSHVADPAGHKGGFRIKVNRRLMEYWAVEL